MPPWHTADERPITVHLDRVTFWDAMLELKKNTGLRVSAGHLGDVVLEHPGPQFHLAPGGAGAPVVVQHHARARVHGPFLIVPDDTATFEHATTMAGQAMYSMASRQQRGTMRVHRRFREGVPCGC
jgi:hypothetical protein